MLNTDFVEWLETELEKRQWRKSDLAKLGGVSAAQITRIIKREQHPGPETCRSIARAFRLPPETVFRIAGLLPQQPDEPPTLREWIHYYLQASDEDRERMLEVARTLSQKSQKK